MLKVERFVLEYVIGETSEYLLTRRFLMEFKLELLFICNVSVLQVDGRLENLLYSVDIGLLVERLGRSSAQILS